MSRKQALIELQEWARPGKKLNVLVQGDSLRLCDHRTTDRDPQSVDRDETEASGAGKRRGVLPVLTWCGNQGERGAGWVKALTQKA